MPSGQPVLDMVFLGMGEDGHVASLFPGEPEEVMADPAVYRAVTAVKPPPRRITLGYGAIAAARRVLGAGFRRGQGSGLEGIAGAEWQDAAGAGVADAVETREFTRILPLPDGPVAGIRKNLNFFRTNRLRPGI